jgi:Xaa-Pro aminopeptidase
MRIASLLAFLFLPALAGAQITPDEYAARRRALAGETGPAILVAFGQPEPRHDYIAFDQGPRFRWLTGYVEPGAILVIAAGGAEPTSMLFVHPRDPATEVWSGIRFGPDGATRATGIRARPLDDFPRVLDSLARTGHPLTLVSDAGDETAVNPDRARLTMLLGDRARDVADAGDAVDRLRGHKSPAEQDLIRKAVALTVAAHREAMRLIEPGMNEFEVEALIEYTFRRGGADRPAFASIVGSGPNSTTLHYNANDRFMAAGDVVVMDVGASYRGYAADVTRTVPVSGTFTADQRAIYQIVRDAQAAAEREAKVGAEAVRMSRAAAATLAAGLAELGLIQAPNAMYDCMRDGAVAQCPQLQLFYMHGLGHGIGLEVHDPEQYYFTGTIAKGSAFTIEPGIYVRQHVLETLADTPRNRQIASALGPAVRRYGGIGVRIEDDYVVTDRGVEWISRAPREIEEIEALMRETYAAPRERDASIVEWYRTTAPPPALAPAHSPR